MAAADIAPPNNFETNSGSFRLPERAHKAGRRKGKAGRSTARAATSRRPELLGPTPERMAKPDAPVKMDAGHYRAPPPIERMRDRGQLDSVPLVNEMMFRAAERLNDIFLGSGLSAGAQAQDLNRVASGGGDPPSGMPINEHAAHCRKELRIALKMMGWSDAYPYRGAGRITLDVVCFDVTVEDAAAVHRGPGRKERLLAIGTDVLREGLFALAIHWRFLRG